MRVAVIADDLMVYSRVAAAVSSAGGSVVRLGGPDELAGSESLDLVLVDWSARRPSWTETLRTWGRAFPGTRVVLFGRHTDLAAHAEARAAGLGPMWARSKLVAELPSLAGRSG